MVLALLRGIKGLLTFKRVILMIIVACLVAITTQVVHLDIHLPWTYDRSPEACKERFERPETQQRIIYDNQGNIIGLKGK